ncbi:hypothetical protein NPA08_04395 [Mycoplasmopsis citelli]|uniref:hypothetical protein n=1 Tax=Mycoplasmopsis citelli TaxID=171281 RepID=UPI0021146431|nr:hypothetical protein [Mycoplasmopsis citelli]UUD36160.1 hypothetical protein NPA08_04395 [Mycoplasmopsis citelli]
MNQVYLKGTLVNPIKWILNRKNEYYAFLTILTQNDDKSKSYISVYLTKNFKIWEHSLKKDTSLFIQGHIITGYNAQQAKNFTYVLAHSLEILHNKFNNLNEAFKNTNQLISQSQNNPTQFQKPNETSSIIFDKEEWE